MHIEHNIPLVDEILGTWKDALGPDHDGYRNHVYRMINFCFLQGDLTAEEKHKIIIAGCFHDLGIWSDNTFDYLPPSVARAQDYLQTNGQQNLSSDISRMIDDHHKLRSADDRLVEIFRKGDLVDFSLGIFKCGLPGTQVREVKKHYPNAGFHKRLLQIGGRWICNQPLNPLPVLKW